MQVRVPRIAREVVERGAYPAGVTRDVEALARDLETDAPVPAPRPPAADVDGWAQAYAEHAGDTWLQTRSGSTRSSPFYRELGGSAAASWETGRDPFRGGQGSRSCGRPAVGKSCASRSRRGGSREERILGLLDDALWGNRVDLSYAVGASRARSDDDLIVDERAAAVPRLACASARVHVVVDNTGTELALDLALVAAVLENPTAVATLHVKIEPVFVSDADGARRVARRVIGRMGEGPAETSPSRGRSLTKSFEDGRLRMAPDAFWVGASPAGFLRQALGHLGDALRAAASIVVFKRRRELPPPRHRRCAPGRPPRRSAPRASYLGAPGSSCCLRTMKSDPVVGLPAGLAERLDRHGRPPGAWTRSAASYRRGLVEALW